MAVEVAGPFSRGYFLCKVPPDTTLGVNSKEYCILAHPLGKESKDFMGSGKGSSVFIKAKDQNERSDKLNLVVNGKEQTLQADINKAAILQLQEIYEKLYQLRTAPEAGQRSPEEGAETDTQSEGKELQTKAPKVVDPADEIGEMISEAEDKVYKTAKERLGRLTELHAMKVRQVQPSSKSDAGLLRRYKREHKGGQQKQLLDQCKAMQKSLKEEQETTTNAKVCRISLQSSFEETKDVLEEDTTIDKMSQMEGMPWETLFGLVGIPVSHTLHNYTDPMNIGINENLKEVVSSSEFALNQKSLWSLSGSDGIRSLDDIAREWGFKNKVTAVVPIKSWNHPTVWKAYHKGPLSSMVTSSQLRGAHIPMQQDEQAFTAAALLRTVTDWAAPNETQAKLMADLLDTIQFTDPRAEGVPAPITEFKEKTEMHIVNNMPSALAPMAKMLESKHVLSFAGSADSGPFWRAMVSNSIYWKVRRAVQGKNRDEILRTLANFQTKAIHMETLETFDVYLTVYARMLEVAQRYNNLGKVDKSLFENNQANVEDFKKFISPSYNVFLLTEVVRALICCGKVTKKLKCPNLESEEGNWQWMKNEHDRREKLGSDHVDAIQAWEGFLQEAPKQTLQEFAKSLNEVIPNEFETIKGAGDKRCKFKAEGIFEKLTNSDTVQLEEKLKLVLFGKASEETQWGNGKGLKNGQIAKRILDFLTPLLKNRPDSALDIGKYERMVEKTNHYTKHWYRKEGSRKGYTNERPSFWAITTYSTPWAFLKKDSVGYKNLLKSLKKLDTDGDIAKETFDKEWQHLLRRNPTKNDCTARGKNAENLSIFPEETTFGLVGLMKKMNISAKDLQIEEEKLPDAAIKIASNWETILQKMLPQEEAQKTAHSLKEVFGIDENSFKAFNVYHLLQEMPDITQRRATMITALVDSSKASNPDCLVETNIEDRTSEINIPKKQIKVFRENSLRILERLLPLRSVELTSSIEDLFKEDEVRKMYAVCHVLQRYSDYGFTSMDALKKLLKDIKLINSTEDIFVKGEHFEVIHPEVSFELKYEIEGKKTEADITGSLQTILDKFKNSENAILWMNLEYERKRNIYNWKPLKVTKKDLDAAQISVEKAWYGGGNHQKVTVEFDYKEFDNLNEISESQRNKLVQLKEFFHLVLENVHQLFPIEAEFVKEGKSSKKNPPVGPNSEYWRDVKEICDLLNGLTVNEDLQEEAASIFNSLGAKGLKYNEALKIRSLLNDPRDVDNLTIRVDKMKKAKVGVINAGPIFVRPEKETRLKELPENMITQIHELMMRELQTYQVSRIEEFVDILVNVNRPDKAVLFEGLSRRREITELLSQYTSSRWRTMISTFLAELKEEDITLGRLTEAFVALNEQHSANEPYATTLAALIEGMKTFMKGARELSEEQAGKQLAKDRKFNTFLKFLKDHPDDGMKKYAKAKGYTKDQFLELAKNQLILPGDMLGFWRKNLTIDYAHAGIYAPVNNSSNNNNNNSHEYVVHIGQQEGRWLRSMTKEAEVKCDPLESTIDEKDTVFYIRHCNNVREQTEVLSKAEACFFNVESGDVDPIKYTYNGLFGSCQTFCSKALGAELLEELNPEALLVNPSAKKQFAGWYLSDDKTDVLTKKMEERFQTRRRYDLPEQDGNLLRTCPVDSLFAAYFATPGNDTTRQ